MQCSIRIIADMWTRIGVQCANEATTVFRHDGRVVSHRCDKHAVGRWLDSQYKAGPLA